MFGRKSGDDRECQIPRSVVRDACDLSLLRSSGQPVSSEMRKMLGLGEESRDEEQDREAARSQEIRYRELMNRKYQGGVNPRMLELTGMEHDWVLHMIEDLERQQRIATINRDNSASMAETCAQQAVKYKKEVDEIKQKLDKMKNCDFLVEFLKIANE